ncbi:hypothetical protein PYW08_010817 [Mythimna loreyi]|uniref:Uncharacterized protein n=1 Tax=Mythimna loreyi TaxID=667449 RepID=A0ACC2Q4L5_9NEOP|nr:hypothetical protein PYW08_010817 [Mythimna loreyi]
MRSARVLLLLALVVEHVHSFSWDFVVGGDRQLHFYYENGSLTHTENISLARWITSVTYDPVHYRMLLSDYRGSATFIYSFDLTTRDIDHLVTRTTNNIVRVVYEPVTQALYWKQRFTIYSLSLNPESSNKADGNRLVELEHYCRDLTVDSCGGYIYWITNEEIERARLDGSEREVLISGSVYDRRSLAIDQPTRTLYWTETTYSGDDVYYTSIERASFNGKNRTTLYIARNTICAFSLALSKNFIYWQTETDRQVIWQLPKYSTQTVATKLHSMSSELCEVCRRIATNYTIQEQTQGIESCDALQALLPNDSRSECAASVCRNYCFQGECSVSAEGHPRCSCKAGYSGERCEVNLCLDYCLHGGVCSLDEDHQRVCQCAAGYEGERCEVSICKNYCSQGNCSVGADGKPKCSCKTGYSGERCEVNTCCHEYCLDGGFCVVNEEDIPPTYQDRAGYDGGRCEVPVNKDPSSDEGTARACHQFCLNDGVCSLSEAGAPVCRCTTDYAGERCDVPAFLAKWVFTHVPVSLSEVKSTAASAVV